MTEREEPDLVVKIIVYVGLVILLLAVSAFVWLFILGNGFTFNF